jgi:ABC-2 type transport system permease protein
MIYLAIGSISETMQDAQAYLMPVSMLMFLPFWLLSQLISNPDAMVAKVMSWIPFYTPFAMMARMGVGVEPWEIIGTSALLVVFVAAEFMLLGRVFKASILRTGQPVRPAEFIKLMFSPAAK